MLLSNNANSLPLLEWLEKRVCVYFYSGDWHPTRQVGNGSKHTMKDLQDFWQGRSFSYDMTIAEFKREFILKEQTNAAN